jgi:hypothetical protein
MASKIAASECPHLIGASMPLEVVPNTFLHEGNSIANEIAASGHTHLVVMSLFTFVMHIASISLSTNHYQIWRHCTVTRIDSV